MAAGQASDESRALRKKLLRLDKNEVAKKCKRKRLSTMGTKGDMVDRLVEYDEENGGVSGAREGSNKNQKKSGTTNDDNDEDEDDDDDDNKKKKKKKGRKTGGAGGGGGRTGGGGSGGGSGGGNGDAAGCYCNCGDNEDDGDNQGNMNKRIVAGIIGIICLILFVIIMAVNALSSYDSDADNVEIVCRWNEVSGCDNDYCLTVNFKNDCDDCNGDCNSCSTMRGGESWLAFNILSFFILLVGVIGVFVCFCMLKAAVFRKWVKVFYIIPAIFSFLAVVSWVVANNYNQSCYDVQNDLTLATSNIINIVNGFLLIIGFILLL